MESYKLKEIHIDDEKQTSNMRVYSWRDVHMFCDVYMEEGQSITFQYVSDDHMDRFEFQLSIADGKLCFSWFAWDGSDYIQMPSSNWLHSKIFYLFMKNKFFVKQNKMMFYIHGVKNHY
ncbi:hypothetical protein [Bacillus sp. 179-C3.3 HS]|uniref:hypothetical protein n=1 Tax=Bacillus sp. 179-C3.3 HS TaxID=3232162 RepID=UPI0039A2FD5F